MITLIEALNFRCLHYIHRPLDSFQVLVGPNASGKTTFLDVVAFLGRLVSDGLEEAVSERTNNFQDLTWGRNGISFELAVEARIPAERQQYLKPLKNEKVKNGKVKDGKVKDGNKFDTVRYEVAIGFENKEIVILAEKGLLKIADSKELNPIIEFPLFEMAPDTILTKKSSPQAQTIINKTDKGDNFYSEIRTASKKGWAPAFKLGSRKSTLGNLPEDETTFPVTTWLKRLLTDGIQQFVLNSMLIRKASPSGYGDKFKADGSNLPWVVEKLKKQSPERFQEWILHLQTALPDIKDIRTEERPDDRSRYLIIIYKGDLAVPSWMASDGTLRLLALTLPAYIANFEGIYLIEEPENGIHPRAVETMYQSLSSVYDAQILMATHSPVILSIAEANKVLCFAKTANGETDIVSGDNHPALRDWRGETNLGMLFASGVLG